MIRTRLKKLRRILRKTRSQGILISSPANVRYMSGFTGTECFLLITGKDNFFIGDFRYQLQAKEELDCVFTITKCEHSVYTHIREITRKIRLKRLLFESRHLSFEQYYRLKTALSRTVKLTPCSGVIEKLRIIKTSPELRIIRKAVAITRKSLRSVKPLVRPGIREIILKNKLEQILRDNGAHNTAFDIIVASGPNAAMPHAHATQRKIRNNEPVIIDVGIELDGYKSDLTRTFFSGKITQYIRYYKLIANAQDRAIKLIRPGVRIQTVDQAARAVLKKAGLDSYFGHALGHGVGLEIHEAPTIRGGNTERLQAGMVFTVEPGIYIPHSGGVRIEDMVLVTEKGSTII